ncbi:MAG: TolC family protein [Firmicutes bacterium]|nr:TolC family protein [Bacillota bacterium]
MGCGFDTIRTTKFYRGLILIPLVLVGLVCSSLASAEEPQVLTLQGAMERAMEWDPAVVAAQDEWQEAQLTQAKGEVALRPQGSVSLRPVQFSGKLPETGEWEFGRDLTLQGSWQPVHGFTLSATSKSYPGRRTREDEGAGLSLSANLDLWPKPSQGDQALALRNARELVDIAAAKFQQAQLDAALTTYREYRLLQVEVARTEVLAQEVEAKAQSLQRVVDKRDQGLAADNDVLAARIEHDSSQAEYRRALRQLEQRKLQLAQRLGLRDGDWRLEPLPQDIPSVSITIDEGEAVAAAKSHSLQVARLEQSLAAARRNLQALRQDLGLAVGVRGTMDFKEEHWEEPTYGAYLSVSYEFADGGRKSLGIKEAELAVEKAERNLQLEQEQIAAAVMEELSELQWLQDQVNIAQLKWHRAQGEYQARQGQAERGLITAEALQSSERALQLAWLDSLAAAIEYEAARLGFMVLIGETPQIEGGAVGELSW